MVNMHKASFLTHSFPYWMLFANIHLEMIFTLINLMIRVDIQAVRFYHPHFLPFSSK